MKRFSTHICLLLLTACAGLTPSKIRNTILHVKTKNNQIEQLELTADFQVKGKMSLIYDVSKDWDQHSELQKWAISEKPFALNIHGKFRTTLHLRRNDIVFEVVDSVSTNPWRFRHYELSRPLSDDFPEIVLTEFFSPKQKDYILAAKRIRYVAPKAGSIFEPLGSNLNIESRRMQYGDKFIIADGTIIPSKDRPGWLKGYWRCEFGQVPASDLINEYPEYYGIAKDPANSGLKLGFIADLGANIYDLPAQDSRVVQTSSTNFPGMGFILTYEEKKRANAWVFVEVAGLDEPVKGQKKDLSSGCMLKKHLGTFTDLTKVKDFPEGLYSGGFGELGVDYQCKKGGICYITNKSFQNQRPKETHGPFQVVRHRDYYAFSNGRSIYASFFIIGNKIHGLSEEPIGAKPE
jgi:hypothetical protein